MTTPCVPIRFSFSPTWRDEPSMPNWARWWWCCPGTIRFAWPSRCRSSTMFLGVVSFSAWAAASPASMPIMAKLGVGLLVIPQKPWDAVKKDFEVYHQVWKDVNGTPPPKPLSGGFIFVDENKDRAEEQAMKWLAGNYRTVIKHYEMQSEKFGTWKSYESYRQINKFIAKHGVDGAALDFAKLM